MSRCCLRPAVMLVVAGLAPAASAWTLGPTVHLADPGLRFSPIAEIPMLPVPAPSLYTGTAGGETFEVYDARELWRSEQLCALFTNRLGRIEVARVASLPPPTETLINGRFIRRAEPARPAALPPGDDDAFAAWIAAFTGQAPDGFSGLGPAQAMRYPIRMYQWRDRRVSWRGFMVRLPDPVRFAWFQFDLPGMEAGEAEPAILASLRSIVAGTTRAAGKLADLHFQRLAATGGQGAEYDAARRRVIANIQALDNWWYVELPHYLLVSNLERQNHRLVKELQANLEKLREQFAAWWAPMGEIREVSVVRVFNTREEYLDYVGRDNGWTMGVWMPMKRELAVSPEHEGADREQILSTVYHEAFHQYVHYALDGLSLPTWLNEGQACLAEAFKVTNNGREIRIDENADRLSLLEHLPRMGLAVDLVELMYLSAEQFYLPQGQGEGVQRQRAAHYAAAWGLVYFLRRGAPAAFPGRGYDRIPARVVDYLRAHPGAFAAAADRALSGIDRDQLRRDYAAFWESSRMRGQARRLP